ncbi:MAG: FkbM family methyltransferase, partial [Rhodoglobus sp.]
MKVLSLDEIAGMSRSEAEDAIRARVQTVYLGENRLLTRILGRSKLFLSTLDVGFAGHVMLDGFWEMWLTQFFATIVKPGMTVIDVGANAGYYTILFGDAVGRHGRVVAVEPVPATVALLRRSVALNGHASTTHVSAVALGKEPAGEVWMMLPEGEPKNAAVVHSESPGAFRVPSTNLDTLARDLALDRVDLIKIDAEGAE